MDRVTGFTGDAAVSRAIRGNGDVTDATIVRELATGREIILPVILQYPRWNASGEAIIGAEDARAEGQNRQRVVACAIAGPCHPLADGAQPVPSADGSRVFFLRPSALGSASRELWSIDRDGRNERQLGTLGPFNVTAIHFDVSKDGQVVWTTVRNGENRIWLSEFR